MTALVYVFSRDRKTIQKQAPPYHPNYFKGDRHIPTNAAGVQAGHDE